MLHESPSKLLTDARLSYKEVSFGWRSEDPIPEEDGSTLEESAALVAGIEGQSHGVDIFESESMISSESAKKNDLSLLGVELDESTINRLESNLGQSLFSTAQKAANTIRVSSIVRNDIQTPMGGHLVDESFLRFTNDHSNEISRVSEAKAASPAPIATSATALPKSMRMSASFAENRDYFLPLASGADEELPELIERRSQDDGSELEEDISALNIVDAIERSQSQVSAEEEAQAVNCSLDYYRKKRSIFRIDLNEIVGDNDCSGMEEMKRETEHVYLKDANASAAFAIEPEMRSGVDKLLLALQVDYMSNPDKFVRRLFGFPLNTPKVSMKVVEKLRYVGESSFFDTIRQVLRAKEAVDKVRSHADIKIENELIWSLFQLLVEKRRLPGEKYLRPMVDLWNFVRNLKTGNRLRALYKEGRPVTREEIEEFAIRSKFYKLDKTNEPNPERPYRINSLQREVRRGNEEIEGERKQEGSIAWRNKSPQRRVFNNQEGKGVHQTMRDMTMLQVLDHNAAKGQRAPIDDENHSRKFSGVPFARAKNESGLMRSILRQEKGAQAAAKKKERADARRKYFENSHPKSSGVSELLDVEAWKPGRPVHRSSAHVKPATTAKIGEAIVQGSPGKSKHSRSNLVHPTWMNSTVSDALHGNYDTSVKNHPRGSQLSARALANENKSGDSDKQFHNAMAKQERRENHVTNQGPARESLVARKAAEQSAANHVPALLHHPEPELI